MIPTRPDEPIALEAAHETTLTISEAPTAVQKPEIVKPGTSHANPIIRHSDSRTPSVITVIAT